MNIDVLHKFLDSHSTCVMARVNTASGVSAATVGFSHDKRWQFLLATNKSTRKYEDLQANADIALVVGFEGAITVQYEGVAKQVTSQELGKRLNQHFEKVPSAMKYAGDANQTYFLVSPTWLRYTDLANPSQSFEIKEFV